MIVLESSSDYLLGEIDPIKLDFDRVGSPRGSAAASGAGEDDVVLLRRLLDEEALLFYSRREEESVSVDWNVRGERRTAPTHEHARPRRDGRSCSCPSEATKIRSRTSEVEEQSP